MFHDMLKYHLENTDPYDVVIVGDDAALQFAMALLPAFSTMIKNKSPKTLRIALMIKKYSGELLSPRALNVLEKKLYKNVNISPTNMMRR